MKIILCLIALFFVTNLAVASDSVAVPVRTHLSNGQRLYDDEIPILYEKDCDPNGWRFDFDEWRNLRRGDILPPRYYNDPEKGSNGGWEIA